MQNIWTTNIGKQSSDECRLFQYRHINGLLSNVVIYMRNYRLRSRKSRKHQLHVLKSYRLYTLLTCVISDFPNAIVHRLMNEETNTVSQRVSKILCYELAQKLIKFYNNKTWLGLEKLLCGRQDNIIHILLSVQLSQFQLIWRIAFHILWWDQ